MIFFTTPFLAGHIVLGRILAVMLLSFLLCLHTGFAQWTNGQSASVVAGQANFISNGASATAGGVNFPEGIAIDVANSKIYVADRGNNRVVRYAYPITVNQPNAEVVFGQINTTNSAADAGGTTGAVGVNLPIGVAVHPPTGDLFIVDRNNHRILRFAAAHAVANGSHGPSAASVIGQPDFTSNAPGTSQNTLNFPSGIVITPGFYNMWIADANNNRVVRLLAASLTATQPNFDRCIGQTLWTAGTPGLSATQLNTPLGVCTDAAATRIFVADANNNRVLMFPSPPAVFNETALLVLGQATFGSNGTGYGSAQIGGSPRDVAMDASGTLFVSDVAGNRVLGYNNAMALGNGASANFVLGQSAFGTGIPGTAQNQFNAPRGLAVDGIRLLVSESGSNRTLMFNGSYLYVGAPGNTVVQRIASDATGYNASFVVGGNSTRSVHAESSTGFLYWGNDGNGTIGRANLVGTGVNQSFVSGVSACNDIFVAGSYIYWTTGGAVGRANVDGTGVNTSFITGCSSNFGLAVDPVGGFIFWTNYSTARIGRANIDGTGINQNFITTGANPFAIDIDPVNGKLYWTHYGGAMSVGMANLDGTAVNNNLVTGQANASGIAVDAPNNTIYWNSGTNIGRAALNGTGVNAAYITGLLPNSGYISILTNNTASNTPTITSFTPTTSASGATVTINGTNFTGATAVSFGGIPAASFTVISSVQITAVVAAGGASGSVNVTTPFGTGTLSGFTFIPAPTIASFSPTTAVPTQTVTINGTNFTGATAVSFGGVAATSFTVVSAVQITAVVAPSSASGIVSLTTPGGTATLAGFTFAAPPTVYTNAMPGSATQNIPYGYTFVTDGIPTPTYTLFSGTLPPGLTLNPSGTISGTPTVIGAFGPIVVQAMNASGTLNTAPFTINISSPLWSNGQNATFVIGQTDFVSAAGGTSSQKLNTPDGVVIDIARSKLYVADRGNNRVLRFAWPLAASNPAAEVVFGQTTFAANAVNQGGGVAANTLNQPVGVAINTSNGDLFVSDYGNRRVLRYASAHLAGSNASAANVYGQPNYVSNGALPVSNQSLNGAHGIGFTSSGNLYVTDISSPSRAVRINNASLTTNYPTFSIVLGKPDFTSSGFNTTQSGMADPDGFADAPSIVFVGDRGNNRLLGYSSFTTGAPASLVLGQTNFTSNSVGNGATQLNAAGHIYVDVIGTLYASDGGNNRVVVYYSAEGKTNGGAADVVLGQAGFGMSASGTAQNRLNNPRGITSDGSAIVVGDWGNNRIMIFTPIFYYQSGNPNLPSNWNTALGGGGAAASNFNGSFTIPSGRTAALTGNLNVNGVFLVQSGGTLNTGAFALTGAASFELQAGAALSVANTNGINGTALASGAIQVTGAIIYSPAAQYSVNQSAIVGVSRLGFAAAGGKPAITQTQNLTFSGNTAGGSWTNVFEPITVNGTFTVQQGIFALQLGSSLTLNGAGNVVQANGTIDLRSTITNTGGLTFNANSTLNLLDPAASVSASPVLQPASTLMYSVTRTTGLEYTATLDANLVIASGTLALGSAKVHNGTVTVNAGATLNLNGNSVTLQGAVAHTVNGTLSTGTGTVRLLAGTLTNTGTVNVQANGTLEMLVAGWSGNNPTFSAGTSTLLYSGSSAVTTANEFPLSMPGNVTVNKTGAGRISLGGGARTLGVSAILTFTAMVDTDPANVLIIANTALGAVVGGSGAAFINGPLRRALPAGNAGVNAWFFPVGKATTYLPFTLQNPTTGAAATAEIEAYNTNANGIPGLYTTTLSLSEYWRMTYAGGYTQGQIVIGRTAAILPASQVTQTGAVPGGTYTGLGGIVTAGAISTITSPIAAPVAATTHFVIGAVQPQNYYYVSGAAENPANWNAFADGSGGPAPSFTQPGSTFWVSNARTASFGVNTTFGASVVLQVENGSSAVIPNGNTITVNGLARINAGGRLVLVGSGNIIVPSGVTFVDSTASVEYRDTPSRQTSDAEFANTMQGSVRVVRSNIRLNASKLIRGNITIDSSSVELGTALGVGNTLTLGGNVIFTNSALFKTDSTNSLVLSGGGTISGSVGFASSSGDATLGRLLLQRPLVTLPIDNSLHLSGSLTLGGGNIHVRPGQHLRLSNTADTALSGGSSSSFVSGSFARVLSPNLTPFDTRTWLYPIGKNLSYLPAFLRGVTTGSLSTAVALEAFTTAAGGSVGIGINGALSQTEYWKWTPLSGAFMGAQIGVLRLGLNDNSIVTASSTQSGTYTSIGGSLQTISQGQALVSNGIPSVMNPSTSVNGSSTFFAVVGATVANGSAAIQTPRVTGFSPATGGEETEVMLIGENLSGVNAVAIGTIPVASFRVLSSTGISITVGAVRTGPIQLGGPTGGTASNGDFTFVPAPVFQSISPQSAAPGSTVTITGLNLQNVRTLTFGGIVITTFTINPNGTITFIVPQGITSSQIRLNSEGGVAQATTGVVLVERPTITGFSPANAATGATVTINGTNFFGVQGVRFGTASANFTRNDSNRITAVVPARPAGVGGLAPISVIASGGLSVSSATLFTYSAQGAGSTSGSLDLTQLIAITDFVDKVVSNGGEVRVRGSNLHVISDISLRTSVGAGKAEYKVSSSGQITLLLPKKNLLAGTTGTVSSSATTVVFLGAYNSVTVPNAFTIVNSPEITNVSPLDAAPGEEIIITGTSLDLVTAITIGGTGATFRLEGTTSIIVQVPASGSASGLPLAGRLSLVSVGGMSVSPPGVIVNAALAGGLPVITSFSPSSGGGGATIIVTGANFSLVSAVTVGGVPAAGYSLISPNELRVRLPSGVSRVTKGFLQLTSPLGESVSKTPFLFTASLEADSAGVVAFLGNIPPSSGTILNWQANTLITEWKGVEVVGNRIVAVRLSALGLRGTLPTAISALSELRVLDVSDNGFTGSISASFAALGKLEEFSASSNKLSGSLTGVVCAWRMLKRFDVSNNSLSGEIPPCLATLDNGEIINCAGNEFTGTIPRELAAMLNLRELRLNNNRLTGTLPREFGTIGTAKAVKTTAAKTTAQITQAQTLQILDLSNNELGGSIPPEWAGMTNLRELHLSNNRLTGEVPRGIASWRALAVLRLGGNMFSGELPSSVQWDNLLELNVENNRLTGALPLELAQSSRLRVLRAAGNSFSSLPNLTRTRLDTVSVEHNRLEFGSLEPLTKVVPAIRSLRYSPQGRIGAERDTVLERGALLELRSGIVGGSTIYQWYKDSSLVRGAAGRLGVFKVDSAVRVNSGAYFCRATNSALPLLTLETAMVRVSVASVDVLLAVPEVIAPAPGAINVSPNLTLRWSQVEGATDYEVRWRKLQGTTALPESADTLAQPDVGEVIYMLRNLERGTSYEWRVRALIRNNRGVVTENGNASPAAFFRVVTAGVDLAFSTVDAGKSAINDGRDVPGGVLINVSPNPLTILKNGLSVVSRDGSFQVKTEQIAGIVQDTTLMPNGELVLGIEFTPREAENIVGTLLVNYRDAQGQQRTATFADALRGRGSALVIKPVDFDTVRVGKATVQSIEVINRSTIHTMQIQAVRILTVRGAPSEKAFTLRDAGDLRIAPRETAYMIIRAATLEPGVRRAGLRVDAQSTIDTTVRDAAVTSITAFARLPKPDDAAVSLRLRAVPDSAPPGTLVRLNVFIEDPIPSKLEAVFKAAQPEIYGRIQFSRQVLSLASGAGGVRTVPDPTGNELANVLFSTRWDGRTLVVMSAEARAVSGRTARTLLNLASVEWGTTASARLPWERKVFVEEANDTSLFAFVAKVSTAGGRRLITNAPQRAVISAIAPNPAKDMIEVQFSLPEDDMVTLTLVDSRGNEVQSLMINEVRTAGQHKGIFKLVGLSSGSYLLRLATSREMVIGRVEVVR